MAAPAPRTPAQRTGDGAEALVAAHLVADGWEVLGRNLHLGRGELDILAVDPGPPPALVVVEVRWRRRRDFGLPEETFDWRKRATIRSAVGRLLERGLLPDGSPLPRLSLRIDLVVVEPAATPGERPRLRHHRHALGG
jgi:putative endonuclease